MKKYVIKAMLDGFMQELILFLLTNFNLSKYTSNFTLKNILVLTVLCSVLSSVIYSIFIKKVNSIKKKISFSIISQLSFVVFALIILALRVTVSLNILPLREINNADGLLILLSTVFYIFISFIFKLFILIILCIKQRKKENNGTVG